MEQEGIPALLAIFAAAAVIIGMVIAMGIVTAFLTANVF
jgi:hypothetical protein